MGVVSRQQEQSLWSFVYRLKGSFAVSGSQDLTIKLWSLKSLPEVAEGAEPVRLAVKYTQLAHDKVSTCHVTGMAVM